MNRKSIVAIMILMSASLIGIAIIQWFWIKWQVDLNETNFENKVTTALIRVKDRIEKDALTYNSVSDLRIGSDNPFDSGNRSKILDQIYNAKGDWRDRTMKDEINKNLLLYSDLFGDARMKENLDKYLVQEFEDQRIGLRFDYGVYSDEDGLFVLNGIYTVPSINAEASEIETSTEKGLNTTDYKISLWKPNEFLKVYFPNKTSFIWSDVLPEMISSIIFTGLILFCFLYTLYVILKQKKISEITNDFINNMTHEFKTPIATISLAADSINSPKILSDESKIKRFINIIKEENKRMLNQVEKVLQMSLLEKGDYDLKLNDLDINQIVNQAVNNLNLQVEKRNGKIEMIMEENLPSIKGDLTHVSNMIHNLLDNANKYSPEPPKIIVKTKNESTKIVVEIIDNGLGLSKEAQKHIFDKFYRVHTGNRHDVKGFGLGLSYVKAMMEAHRGSVTVESELGKGSTFYLFFPINV
jgi:two-component system phosphate regulon sensor histidine kinase PhoR